MALVRWLSCVMWLAFGPLQAQQIDLSLHATAVPDSFEVRATATGGEFTAIPSGMFTLRWELASGGIANNGDVARPCGAFAFYNYGGTVDIGAYRYFTLVLIGDRPLAQAGCPIGTEGTTLCGVRIRELNGCRNVGLVQNAYTGMNNLDYYFSVGGVDATGTITTGPIPGGDCSGCVPPVIQSIQVGDLPECGTGPLDFSVVATGTDLEYNWRSPTGDWIGYAASGAVANGVAGLYSVTVSNGCGTAVDSVLTGFDATLCDPATLEAVWFEMLPPAAQLMRLHSAGTGSCLSYRWILPNGTVYNGTTPVSLTAPTTPGLYTFLLFSACGTDTMQLELTPDMICLAPEITSVTSDAPVQVCNVQPFALSAQATQDPMYEWTGPDGVWTASGASVLLDPPQHGLYRVRALNNCGMDSAFYWVQLDTAGLATCVPPVIVSLTSNGPVCAGDSLLLEAEIVANGPCLSYNWWGANVEDPFELSTIASNSSGYYMFYVSSACGSALQTLDGVVLPHFSWEESICSSSDTLVELASLIGLSSSSLTWMHNGTSHGPWYDSTIDTSGVYVAFDAATNCPLVELTVVEIHEANAGHDGFIQICSDTAPVDLFPLLGAEADSGGYWSYAFGVPLPGGIFDPEDFSPALTWHFHYWVGIGACVQSAQVTVEVVEDPFPWYADTDGDGLGDPLDSLLSCDPVEGYIQAAGDACPQLFGTVGDPCDDGNSATHYDVITEACICAGELGTGMAELLHGQLLLWPNPAHGGAFFLQVPVATGRLSVALHDATGRVVWQGVLPASPNPLEVQLPEGTASGSYVVSVLAANGRWVQRLVVD